MSLRRHTCAELQLGMLVLAACAVLFGAAPAMARTWRVERDGSGDFTVIKPAIAAASPGDTIQIGPGRYDQVEPFSLPGWTEPTYVGVDKDDLTFRGTDRDGVIIGPTSPNFTSYGPKGFVTQVNVTRMTVENLTVEYVHDGLYLLGDVTLRGCLLKRCDLGVSGGDGLTMLAEDCEIDACREGIIVFDGHDLDVVDSTFHDHSVGVTYIRCVNGNVTRCTFSNGGGGAKYSESDGVVQYCEFSSNQNYALISHLGSDVEFNDNSVQGGTYNLEIVSSASVHGSGNRILGSTYVSVLLQAKSTCNLQHNDIVPAQGRAVEADGYLTGNYQLDLTNNYWGVDTAAQIAARIWDSHDDPSIHATVLFEPFAVESVPTRTDSFGGLKALFGGGGQE